MNHAWNCVVLSHFALAFSLLFHPTSFLFCSPYVSLFQGCPFHPSSPQLPASCVPSPSAPYLAASLCLPDTNTVCPTLLTALTLPGLASAPCPFSCNWEDTCSFHLCLPPYPHSHPQALKLCLLELNTWFLIWIVENNSIVFKRTS